MTRGKSTLLRCFHIALRFWLVSTLQVCYTNAASYQPMGRIVGGSAAATNAAPFIVSIQYDNMHYCGGSIISANWVVTAAHCFVPAARIAGSTLLAGSNNVDGTASTAQRLSVTKTITHHLYNGGIAPYDIGLIYTNTGFSWTTAVKAITLPTSGVAPTGTATLYGWGSVSTTSVASYPTLLQVATNLPIISLSSCETALGDKGKDVHKTNICTGPLTGGIGICTSDSGGPLVQVNNGKTVLVGIVSWGRIPCGQANSPSVFVQVSDFVSWITKNV